jgi:S-DNA-T family DNA segregation ATPase FtsK/SpoIIIE
MTFPLDSLHSAPPATTARGKKSKPSPEVNTPAPSPPAPSSWALGVKAQVTVFLTGAVLILVFLALTSYHVTDPAFSTSGDRSQVKNLVGALGAWASDLSFFLFGFSVWWLMVIGVYIWLGALGTVLRGSETPTKEAGPQPPWIFWLGVGLLLCASCALEWTRLYQWEARVPGGHAGGALGYTLGQLSQRWLGFSGSGVFWIALLIMGFSMAFRFSWMRLAEQIGQRLESFWHRSMAQHERAQDLRTEHKAELKREREKVIIEPLPIQVPVSQSLQIQPPAPQPMVIEAPVVDILKSERVIREKSKSLFSELPDTKLPQVDLLDAPPRTRVESVTPETIEMISRLIEKKLKDFGVEVRVVTASPGPVITRYEIEPATGVKGSQVVNLAKDLARSLSLVSIRVVETIPGKTTMALELPNPKRQTIHLSEILGSAVYHEASSMLTMGLGKDIVGNPVVADLAKMPHCLVAGTTGSGKSVGINAMILSLLYKAEARDVRLILIDPKMLEMSVYEAIPHLLCPVVTDMKQAANALNWGVGEMERRYKLMSKLGVRNLSGYNKKISEAAERGETLPNPFSLTPEAPEPLDRLPCVVIVIDELADLMMVVGKKIEELIARLAQKARAAGIHLILATQRPSVDVITGLIKANIPTRLSFQVSSKIDSRTILDQMGAEALLGMGDMLYMASGTGLPVRVHGAFVSDEEVHRVVDYLKSQGEPNYIEGILEGGTLDGEGDEQAGSGLGADSGESDAMYDQAVAIVLQHRRASISLVQRHLRIGYNRAARLLEQMEKSGVVSGMSSNGNRDIMVPARAE